MPVTLSQRLEVAESRVVECQKRLAACDEEIVRWAATHNIVFDLSGAVTTWHPNRVEEFILLNHKRSSAWNEFQAALSTFAELKSSVCGQN